MNKKIRSSHSLSTKNFYLPSHKTALKNFFSRNFFQTNSISIFFSLHLFSFKARTKTTRRRKKNSLKRRSRGLDIFSDLKLSEYYMYPSLFNKAIVKNAHGLKWKIPRGWANKKLEKFKWRRKMQKKILYMFRWSCDAVVGTKKRRKIL